MQSLKYYLEVTGSIIQLCSYFALLVVVFLLIGFNSEKVIIGAYLGISAILFLGSVTFSVSILIMVLKQKSLNRLIDPLLLGRGYNAVTGKPKYLVWIRAVLKGIFKSVYTSCHWPIFIIIPFLSNLKEIKSFKDGILQGALFLSLIHI